VRAVYLSSEPRRTQVHAHMVHSWDDGFNVGTASKSLCGRFTVMTSLLKPPSWFAKVRHCQECLKREDER
jgi:hypothetical protein